MIRVQTPLARALIDIGAREFGSLDRALSTGSEVTEKSYQCVIPFTLCSLGLRSRRARSAEE
jgi:hypothetical protein